MLNINVTEDGSNIKIDLEGSLDAVTYKELQACISELSENVMSIEADLKKLDYISSAGLRVLLAMHNMMKQRGGKLTISHPGDLIMMVLEDTGLTEVMNIVR